MNRTYRLWYVLALLLALAPAGWRLLQWRKAPSLEVDPEMARAGEVLFKHEWRPKDPLCPDGDGLGPLYNATSCVACHNQGGAGGSGGTQQNVTTFMLLVSGQEPRAGLIHAHHTGEPRYQTTMLERLRSSGVPQVSQRNTPALFGAKLIDEIPERVILAEAKRQRLKWGMGRPDPERDSLDRVVGNVESELDGRFARRAKQVAVVPLGRVSRLADGRIARFGWKAQTATLSDFVRAACANELGLGNPGNPQPTPLLWGESASPPAGFDLTELQCDQLTAFCASLPRPKERLPKDVTAARAAAGEKRFRRIGCADCHTPNLGSVNGIYSDLLLHDMGPSLSGSGNYGSPSLPTPTVLAAGPSPSEWRTPPLWGVADSAPYLHDGQAATLEEAIRRHGGQGQRAADAFAELSPVEQHELIAFLNTLRAP